MARALVDFEIGVWAGGALFGAVLNFLVVYVSLFVTGGVVLA